MNAHSRPHKDLPPKPPPDPLHPLQASFRQALDETLDKLKLWARTNSPWAIHFNSGSCNGCDIEILATLTPRYDVERFGIRLEGSPRHADILICTGPVTRQARDRLARIYAQMPEPKYVIAVGCCSISGGVFQGCYNVLGGIDHVIPVDMYIPGCPPRPEAIIDGVVKLLSAARSGAAGGTPSAKTPAPKPTVIPECAPVPDHTPDHTPTVTPSRSHRSEGSVDHDHGRE